MKNSERFYENKPSEKRLDEGGDLRNEYAASRSLDPERVDTGLSELIADDGTIDIPDDEKRQVEELFNGVDVSQMTDDQLEEAGIEVEKTVIGDRDDIPEASVEQNEEAQQRIEEDKAKITALKDKEFKRAQKLEYDARFSSEPKSFGQKFKDWFKGFGQEKPVLKDLVAMPERKNLNEIRGVDNLYFDNGEPAFNKELGPDDLSPQDKEIIAGIKERHRQSQQKRWWQKLFG